MEPAGFKGTKGDWRLKPSGMPSPHADIGIYAEGDKNVFAEVFEEFHDRGVFDPVERDANAKLLVASKHLLAACQKAKDWFDSATYGTDTRAIDIYNRLGAAIEKALG